MKDRQLIKISITIVILFTLCLFPSLYNQASAKSPVPKITKHSYKGISSLKYPQVSGINKKTASKINSTLKKAAEKSHKSYLQLKKAEKAVSKKELCKKTPKCSYSYNTLFQVKYNANGKLSLYYSDYAYTGGKSGKTHVTMYNFDLVTGKHYKIKDILKTSCTYKKVQKYAFAYLSTHKPYSDTVLKISDVTVNKNTQFSFYKGGIYLVYQEYGTQYDDGTPFIKIPKSVYQ
ncbi:DUF4163 domain-containing protein [Peribacillus psychrosaccharolyticus]|uniref:DUF4163 domain-containing protein n=1 Tax=Peribacillus psychrosaccharolyticus TaxID=1407 RepID=A0A974NMS3_PERPY|nr:DUF4163 domain-containing protein [Peribacillus psychrosaccharolyticus]MEC2056322.1 DUF4163 domain-containing protein [Peribacillus psychrosaccharolyticus]MED3743724.1 DUF4163 domain-containing protein [Peribacillus psychrosaccharolyticus]QQT00510.1 DUF4163 domain-containing protein [Peribacillus psychrosaccharolyticus]